MPLKSTDVSQRGRQRGVHPPTVAPPAAHGLRADARRSRQQILAAARAVFVDRGTDAPLDEVARRAGVGNATLYRHFPDRQALLRAVMLEVFLEVGRVARLALTQEGNALHALGRYMHRALDSRIGTIMPALVGLVPLDQEITRARDDLTESVHRMLARAHADGSLRPDVVFGDIGLVLSRFSRPLPGPLPPDLDIALAHRHLDLVMDGLRALPGRTRGTLRGPALTLEDLRARSHGSESHELD